MREAMQTWLNVEDDPQVLEDEIELELQAVEEDLANLDVEDDDVLSEEEGGGGRPESCITPSITEAQVHSRFEEIRSYLYAKGRGGEYSETQYSTRRQQVQQKTSLSVLCGQGTARAFLGGREMK